MSAGVLFKRRDLTSGSILKNLIFITIPLWIETVVYIGLPPWELYLVGKLGSKAIAAMAIGGAGLRLFLTPIIALSNSAIALVGDFIGQKNSQAANQLAREILTLVFLLSLVLAIIGYLVTPPLLRLLGAESEVLALAIPYLRILMVGGIIVFPTYAINSILRGAGEMRIPMMIVCGDIIINAVLLPPLILGLGFFPKMGLNGSALAWVVSGALATLAGLWILIKGKSAIKVSFGQNKFWPQLTTIKRILNLGGLNSLEMFFMSVISLVMTGLVASWGTPSLAAYGIGQRLLMMVSLPGFDLATTSNIIMANNLGAKKIKRAELSSWLACGLNALIMVIAGIILFHLASQMVGIFDKTPEVVKIGSDYLRITTPGWFLLAIWFILRRTFIGAKDAKTPFLITLFGLGGLQIPLALWLAGGIGLGVNGIWFAILIAAISQGLISAGWFRLGKWKPKLAAS